MGVASGSCPANSSHRTESGGRGSGSRITDSSRDSVIRGLVQRRRSEQTVPVPGSPGAVSGAESSVSMSPPPPHGEPAVLTWRHDGTPSSTPPTARYRPAQPSQTVGEASEGSLFVWWLRGWIRPPGDTPSEQLAPTGFRLADAAAMGNGAGASPSGSAPVPATRRAVGFGVRPKTRRRGTAPESTSTSSGSRCLHRDLMIGVSGSASGGGEALGEVYREQRPARLDGPKSTLRPRLATPSSLRRRCLRQCRTVMAPGARPMTPAPTFVDVNTSV
jgi:hypothetical protein